MISTVKENKLLIALSIALIGFGLFKPDIKSIFSPNNNNVVIDSEKDVAKPTDPILLEACEPVTKLLKSGSTRKADSQRLSSLYFDLATLISLDNDEEVIKTTMEIREANKLAGSMSRLNLKDKYPGLAEACNSLVVAGIGENDVVLDKETRQRAVETFMALSWACSQGAK